MLIKLNEALKYITWKIFSVRILNFLLMAVDCSVALYCLEICNLTELNSYHQINQKTLIMLMIM